MARKRKLLIFLMGDWLGFACAGLLATHDKIGWLPLPFVVLFGAGILLLLYGLRCPRCRGPIGATNPRLSGVNRRLLWRTNFCAYCGVSLDDPCEALKGAPRECATRPGIVGTAGSTRRCVVSSGFIVVKSRDPPAGVTEAFQLISDQDFNSAQYRQLAAGIFIDLLWTDAVGEAELSGVAVSLEPPYAGLFLNFKSELPSGVIDSLATSAMQRGAIVMSTDTAQILSLSS